ncbi:FtsW/RodA/SpoVE family cell cycle protein [Virgibacillus salinus]|uniref:Cell elongation-specific peptidoglycan biosynthesis regulator RodA n=1 Tax=Virgibacillus salinus TaxID=553311 RepID=A0A1H1GHV9_9BACI|nr:FtsW/RodA/SpoVE family cell cycle protein [Virgibacillus salinus]SDR12852.1 cell elongation-specific peptidoglycan biosynthesis regulator RodA [Virgibacillus salinus]
MSTKQSHYIQSDFIILLTLFICVSLISIYNAQQLPQYNGDEFVLKQILWFIAGILIAAVIQFFDLEQLYKASILIYIVGVLVLIGLLISPESIAPIIKGQKSWFTLPGMSMQPAEFTKITTVLYLAAAISRHKQKYEISSLKSDSLLFLKIVLITAIPVILIMNQPDFGTSMVYIFIACMMVLLSGIDWKIIIGLILAFTIIIGGAVGLTVKFPEMSQELIGLEEYQVKRVTSWLDPSQETTNDTFQFDRSIRALGSGQLFGKGLSSLQVGTPDNHTDFIFSVIGESFGFLGTAIVVFLYFLLLYKLVKLGLTSSQHTPFGAYLCLGYMSILLIHAFQNIGMTIGIMPITGIPLLLISYGGSSVLATMIGLGLVYRVAVEYSIQQDYLFK